MKGLCGVDQCDRKIYRGSFCKAHHSRFKAYGDPLAGQRNERGANLKWLYAHVGYENDACLLWPFGRRDNGMYGQVTFRSKPMRASRAMCIIAHGEPPSDIHQAAHSCGNGLCVNPLHLRWATPKQNTHDKWLHGTMSVGEKVSGSKLTAEQVLEIRRLGDWLGQSELAKQFGIRQPNISNILNRKTWRHL